MERKKRLLTDPGVSTFFRATMENSPAKLEELCNTIGVQRQRGRNWMKELADEDLISVERKQGEITIKIEDDNIQALNSFATDLQKDFSTEIQKWDQRLGQAANEMVRIKDTLDDEERIEEINEKLRDLKDYSEEINVPALKTLSDAESFLGYGEIAREEMHAFHRKFKVLDKISGL